MILSDTDHLWGIGGNQAWVWKSFCRGLNPLFMDPYRNAFNEQEEQECARFRAGGDPAHGPHDGSRCARAWATRWPYAERMDLAAAIPHNELASSGYCLAEPGREYLVYFPEGNASRWTSPPCPAR